MFSPSNTYTINWLNPGMYNSRSFNGSSSYWMGLILFLISQQKPKKPAYHKIYSHDEWQHAGQWHAQLWFILYHTEVHCNNSQNSQDYVYPFLDIRCSWCPEIIGKACKYDQLSPVGLEHLLHYLLICWKHPWKMAHSSWIDVWICWQLGNM